MRKLRGVLLLVTATFLLLSLSGCGVNVSTKSPENVTKSIIQAYIKGDENAVKQCFGLSKKDKVPSELSQEVNYDMNLFQAHGADSVKFTKCESLGNFNGFELVYVIYNMEKQEKNSETLEIPAMSFYYVQKKQKKYYIVPAKDVTEDMSENSRKEYRKFMKTDEYKTYERDYRQFIRKNPSYEEDLSKSLQKITDSNKQ